jgi:hypothetical protein
MKRTILSLTALFLIVLESSAQITGTGTLANPYHGINAGDFTISGTKYFDGNMGVSAGRLILLPGTKLISISKYACILISGTGRIEAQGTLFNRITITADLDLDGIAGESTDFWGNIYMTSTGSSSFNYCTVENGNRTRFVYQGGAICISAGSVTINNCLIRNSTASRGGGIYIESGTSPVISNTMFVNNKASERGGAIFIAAGSSPVISSSVFRNNYSLSATLKGGTIAVLSASPVIVNSTIAYSQSPAADGKSIYLENSPDSRIINTIFWGGSSHIGLSGTPASVIDFCAIEGASYAGCINLNSSNTAADGPNFSDPGAGDFNLEYISPLRDTGTDSYAGVTVPPFDFIGSGRVSVTDIGAYEMIYSRWHGGTTAWSATGNWDGGFVPSGTNIIIPSGMPTYPTGTPGPSVTIATGLEMILEPGAQATFTSLTNNGTIELHSDASGMASLLTGSYSGAGGNIDVDLYLTGSSSTDLWHYITPPVTVSKTVFTDIEPDMLASYDETKVQTDVVEGWQWHDGYDGTTPFSQLEAKKGYDVSLTSNTTLVFRNLKSLTTSIGTINLPFSGSGGDTTIHGYSLLGNSLTCGINWDMITVSDVNYVRDAYYVRTATGEEASYVNGVGTNGATAHLPPMQGFFVKTRASGTSLTIPAGAREHNAAPRFKSSQEIALIGLTISSATTKDEMIVRFEQESTMDFDYDYDAGKLFTHNSRGVKLFSAIRGEDYSINTIPWPSRKISIPLTVIIPEEGTFNIDRNRFQAISGYKIVLTDRVTGSNVDLTAFTRYSFSADAGTFTDRFLLTVSPVEKAAVITPEKKTEVTASSLKIYSASGRVCILPQGTDWDNATVKVRIYDITGRMILASNDEMFNSGELKEYFPSSGGGLLIVEVMTGAKRYLEKVVLAK